LNLKSGGQFSVLTLSYVNTALAGWGSYPPPNNFKVQKIGQKGKDLVKIFSHFSNEIRREFFWRKLSKKLDKFTEIRVIIFSLTPPPPSPPTILGK
jgi:hypothetical protein